MNNLTEFINLYSLQKTLRFELKPVGKTLEHINNNELLQRDEQRAESYIKAKEIIDEYHKDFIENSLVDFRFQLEDKGNKDSLTEYYSYYSIKQKNEADKKIFSDIQANLREQIASKFSGKSGKKIIDDDAAKRFQRLFAKELIKEDLIEFIKSESYIEILKKKNKELNAPHIEEKIEKDLETISEFNEFTTYFSGFHDNRKNMYTTEDKSTAIAFRLIHQNLSKFIDNIFIYEKIKETSVSQDIKKLYQEMKEHLNVNSIDSIFAILFYNNVLTQKQIDIYNTVIGGKSVENDVKIKGLNEYINLYNQQQSEKSKRLPKLKPLYKQILSDRNTVSFLSEQFNSDNEMLQTIESLYREIDSLVINKSRDGESSLKQLLINLNDYDLHHIYLRNDQSLTDISQKFLGNWDVIQRAVELDYEKEHPKKDKESAEKYDESKKKYFKSFDSLSIGYINECLQLIGEPYNKKIQDYFIHFGSEQELKDAEDIFKQIENAYNELEELMTNQYPENKDLSQDQNNVDKIKHLLDSLKSLQRFVKPLLGKGEESDKDERFYGELTELWNEFDKVTPLYNKVRNRMTRKPYSEEKIQLFFENKKSIPGRLGG